MNVIIGQEYLHDIQQQLLINSQDFKTASVPTRRNLATRDTKDCWIQSLLLPLSSSSSTTSIEYHHRDDWFGQVDFVDHHDNTRKQIDLTKPIIDPNHLWDDHCSMMQPLTMVS
jgi:hypothetical protein